MYHQSAKEYIILFTNHCWLRILLNFVVGEVLVFQSDFSLSLFL